MSYQARVSALNNAAFKDRVGTLLTRAAIITLKRDDIPAERMPAVLGVCHSVFFDYENMANIAVRMYVSMPGADVALAKDETNIGAQISDDTIMEALISQFDMFVKIQGE